jgi:hypothetical protein
MSIAAKKAAQRSKGPEIILNYMGGMFLLVVLFEIILILALKIPLSNTVMTPLMFFTMMGTLMFGLASYLRESDMDITHWRNWVIGVCAAGILVGAILGAYMW